MEQQREEMETMSHTTGDDSVAESQGLCLGELGELILVARYGWCMDCQGPKAEGGPYGDGSSFSGTRPLVRWRSRDHSGRVPLL